MPKFIDYSNRKIGRVLVISLKEKRLGATIWNCRCDCDNNFSCYNINFKRGEKFECKKCILERRRGIDLVGRKYGRWTIIKRCLDKRNKTVWHCKCDCGNEGYIATCSLGNPKKSMSCGCLGRKKKSKWANPSLYPKASGISNTKFYRLRTQIIHKCYNKEWSTYDLFGGKDITVCDLWRNSAKDMYEWAIENGWKDRVSIILKEGRKEFSPDNVYLIDHNELRADIAKQHALKISYKGETLSISEWSKKLDINITSLRKRLKKYLSIEEAFESYYRKFIFCNNTHWTRDGRK